jgi:hypothetical protein
VNPVKFSHIFSLRSISIWSSHIYLHLPKDFLPFRCINQNFVCISHFYHSSLLILLPLVYEECKLWSCALQHFL